jgi:hypothetical protein
MVFAAIPTLVCGALFLTAYHVLGLAATSEERGQELNVRAWNAIFLDRGLTVPDNGPRDGFQGSRLHKKRHHSLLGWVEREQRLEGMLDVDNQGMQHWRSVAEPVASILIVGASVAFGVQASCEDKTYYAVAGRKLESIGCPIDISILAACAWKSDQERLALMLKEYDGPFRIVVFLDGLNELTAGRTARDRFAMGRAFQPHALDFEARVKRYLGNMAACAKRCAKMKSQFLIVLQPTLFERSNLTDIDVELLAATFHGSLKDMQPFGESYRAMCEGLHVLAEQPHVHFLNASRLFDDEPATTFSDVWHFSDPGQELLGTVLAEKIYEMLDNQRQSAPASERDQAAGLPTRRNAS